MHKKKKFVRNDSIVALYHTKHIKKKNTYSHSIFLKIVVNFELTKKLCLTFLYPTAFKMKSGRRDFVNSLFGILEHELKEVNKRLLLKQEVFQVTRHRGRREISIF